MEKVYIGYVAKVHGLRGDLKIKNRFDKPEKVFKKNAVIYLNDECHTITASKFYKGYYLITIDNLKDINEVTKYIGYEVYIDRENLELKKYEYILDDLYGLDIVCNEKKYGRVKEIFNNGKYEILLVEYDKNFMIPLVDEYIVRVDLKNKEIICKNIEGLIL